MRKLFVIFIIVLSLSGCSANYHLRKALEKDPQIIDVKADTTVTVQTFLKDTVYKVDTFVTLMVVSDTAFIELPAPNLKDIPITKVVSSDGIATAAAWVEDGKLFVTASAKVDTLVALQIKLRRKNKVIERTLKIAEERKAIIKEKESIISRLEKRVKIWFFILLGVLLLLLFWRISRANRHG